MIQFYRWYDIKIHKTIIHKLSEEYWCDSEEIEIFNKWCKYNLTFYWVQVMWWLDAFYSSLNKKLNKIC